jgi:Flp pilus assembly protein TadG
MRALRLTLHKPIRQCPISSTSKLGILWSQSGQTLYELALLTPFLLLLLLGVIELGRFAYLGILVANAARAGAAYGAQSLAQSADGGSIQTSAKNDFKNNGQDPANLTVQAGTFTPSYFGCTCDNNGTISPDPPTAAYCDPNQNPTAHTCPAGQHWVVVVSVEAKEQFSSLFNFIPALSSITIDRTCTLRVIQ